MASERSHKNIGNLRNSIHVTASHGSTYSVGSYTFRTPNKTPPLVKDKEESKERSVSTRSEISNKLSKKSKMRKNFSVTVSVPKNAV